MTKRILIAVALTALMASFLFADTTTATPPSPPTVAEIVANQVAHLTTLLDLTASQQTLATSIFTTQQTALAALQTSMQTAQAALQTAVKANDTNGIAAAASQIGALTIQQVTAQATGDAAFWAILTADQQTKFAELNAPGQGGQGPGGAGPGGPPPAGSDGPGGPPPPPKK